MELSWLGVNEPETCKQTPGDCLWIVQAMVISSKTGGTFREPWLTVGVSQRTGKMDVREQPPDEWLF